MADQNNEQARFNMIAQQIRPWEVLDQRVLDTMAKIPREAFVPESFRKLAFADTEIPLGHGQSMMAPKIEARMLQALNVQPEDQIIEIGTGSGYITACLATLGGSVTSFDIQPEFIDHARSCLGQFGIENVELHTADGLLAAVDGPRVDVIAVTGSLPTEEPLEELRDRIAIDGRLFVVVGESPVMEAFLLTRLSDNDFLREGLFETDLAPLSTLPKPRHFVF